MNKKPLLALILMQLVIISYAQNGYGPGYIITNDSDTLKGLIKQKSNYLNSRSCDFIYGNKVSEKAYSPSDIKAYRFLNSKYYVSREVTIDSIKQRVFLEYLVDGIIKLYYLKDLQKEYYFLEKDNQLIPISNETSVLTVKESAHNGDSVEVKYSKTSYQYRRILAYLFKDSPTAAKEIANVQFNYRSLIGVTVDYHNDVCKDRKCIDFTKSTKQDIFLEPYAGLINEWMSINTSTTYARHSTVNAGIRLRLKPFKRFSKWDFLMGVNFSSSNFTGDFDNKIFDSDYIRIYRIHTQYSSIHFPVTFEYSLGQNNIHPFLTLSYDNIFLLNPGYSITRMDGSNKLNHVTVESKFRTYQFGLSPGMGLKLNMESHSYLFVKGEYEFRRSLLNTHYILDYQKIQSLQISIGIGFRLN
jgi:hypothetical protein